MPAAIENRPMIRKIVVKILAAISAICMLSCLTFITVYKGSSFLLSAAIFCDDLPTRACETPSLTSGRGPSSVLEANSVNACSIVKIIFLVERSLGNKFSNLVTIS